MDAGYFCTGALISDQWPVGDDSRSLSRWVNIQ